MAHVENPGDLKAGSWWGVLKRTIKGFKRDNLTDWAAALTYYAVLSLFPGLIVLSAGLAMMGRSATDEVIKGVSTLAPGEAGDIIVNAFQQLRESASIAGPMAVLGLLGALWTASGYIGAFMRASNAIYEMPEGRPAWKILPLRVVITLSVVVLVSVSALAVVLTGSVAERVASLLGVGSVGVRIWDIAKWPAIAVLVGLALAVLYWAAPNVRQPKFRWVTPGGLVAVVLWVAASAGFGLYVSNFASYNKTYGTLGGVIAFLVWLWISNIAVLFGAELDAELARARAIAKGVPPDRDPFLPPRDTHSFDEEDHEAVDEVTEAARAGEGRAGEARAEHAPDEERPANGAPAAAEQGIPRARSGRHARPGRSVTTRTSMFATFAAFGAALLLHRRSRR